jgi:hypothetical protein
MQVTSESKQVQPRATRIISFYRYIFIKKGILLANKFTQHFGEPKMVTLLRYTLLIIGLLFLFSNSGEALPSGTTRPYRSTKIARTGGIELKH